MPFGHGDPRFPVGITIVFLDEYLDRRKSVMVYLAAQSAGRPLHDDVLVHFVVAARGRDLGQLFVSA